MIGNDTPTRPSQIPLPTTAHPSSKTLTSAVDLRVGSPSTAGTTGHPEQRGEVDKQLPLEC